MDSNIKKIEKDLDILNKKLDEIESEIDNLEMKVAIIKEMQKDEGLKASEAVEGELKKILERLQTLMATNGIYEGTGAK